MRNRLRLHHLLWILPAAVVAVAVACSGSTPQSPTAATSISAASGSTPGSGPTSGTGTSGSTGFGTLSVAIKDSPFVDAKAVLVAFSEVSAHMSGSDGTDGEWKTLWSAAGDTRTCDLKNLVAATDVLGIATLPEGHYTQLRLTAPSATIYLTETTTVKCALTSTLSMTGGIEVSVPSSTLKLNRQFDVINGGTTTILLDFDGDKSIHQTGNGKFMMTPVIGVVSVNVQ